MAARPAIRPEPSFTDDDPVAALRRVRGRIAGKWIAWPVVGCLVMAAAIAVGVGIERRPAFVPYVAALYFCVAFFAHAYMIAWRAERFVWRYAALALTLLMLAVTVFVHVDEAEARIVYVADAVAARPPAPALFAAIAFDLVAALLLSAHGLALGLGSRASEAEPSEEETAPETDDDDALGPDA